MQIAPVRWKRDQVPRGLSVKSEVNSSRPMVWWDREFKTPSFLKVWWVSGPPTPASFEVIAYERNPEALQT